MNKSELVQKVIDSLYWESVERDGSVWNPRAIPLKALIERLEENGHVVRTETLSMREGATFERACLGEDSFTDTIETVRLTVDGAPLLVEVLHSWHGGLHSGGPFSDVRLLSEE